MARMHGKKPVNTRLVLLICIATAIPLFIQFLYGHVAWLKNFELQSYDHNMADLTRLRPDSRLVIVGMDDESLNFLYEHRFIDRPAYSRSMQARLLRELYRAGAKVVAFDVYFTGDAPKNETLALQSAMRDTGIAVVALKSEDAPGADRDTPGSHFTEPVPELRPYAIAGSILFPRTAGNVVRWFAPWPPDTEDPRHRRFLHLSVAAATRYFGESSDEPTNRDQFQMGRIRAPFIHLDRDIAVRFIGPPYTFVPDPATPSSARYANYLPYEQVYTGEWEKQRGLDFFRQKLVLIGRVSPHEDRVITPVGDMPGVELEANAIQTLLQGNWLRQAGAIENYVVVATLCLIVAALVWRLNLAWGGVAVLAASVVWYLLTSVLFKKGLWFHTAGPILSSWLTYGAASALEAWKTRDVFRRFVPSQVADDILRAPDAETIEREVAIAFCDVRNYTQISESISSEAVEAMLHSYFLAGESAADRFGGVLDKIVGDEMMVYFEPRQGRESHILRAVRWALTMQQSAEEIDASGAAGKVGFHIGIGISSGAVRFGRIKARQRLQHTVVGDAVNLASRLQGITKEVHRGIVLSDDSFRKVRDRVTAEPLGSVTVKGKQEPQIIHCPIEVLD